MLQRFVRSIVSTAPRPCWMDDVPWLCSVSVTDGKSRPGKSDSSRSRNAGSMASVSVNVPCDRAGLLDDDLAVALERCAP